MSAPVIARAEGPEEGVRQERTIHNAQEPLSALPKHMTKHKRKFRTPATPVRTDSDTLESKPFGPETYYFVSMDQSLCPSFIEALLQTEHSFDVLRVDIPTKPPSLKVLCIVGDLGWCGFLYKFVLDYNLTFGEGEHIVKWCGTTPPPVTYSRPKQIPTPPPLEDVSPPVRT
ncbi:uncharacterized protein SPPG_01417 [Spizellomyces punctatus DAOM BR117]|uniref:Uncharacterized protein n=1 Tax=Spizellomyces punctatus (strain DAOM BR117) TaxID=645134 RepID=A0A0L0HRG5_SPIPD|nr:uncharacterized protein SPPG_01417 [Spizellomyces punctatus DAOM BR117]KND03966.1 hypothetical protein SPPG_01417 [Spizellomyces punctatus DAOM BR117]|eukprot:XP_016612005.1 hypothetical protein SPPG_01417 [Spizellomyces punctatus DAOM BR117]